VGETNFVGKKKKKEEKYCIQANHKLYGFNQDQRRCLSY